MKATALAACLLFCSSAYILSQELAPRKIYNTNHIEKPPLIDGVLDDEAWTKVDWGGDFIQRSPEDGAAPSQQTQFKIIYDYKFIYVGVRAFDTEPDLVARRMSRRDGFEGDFIEINIDSYNDKRTAFSFSASASGVKGEEYISNNGEDWDSTWDPIWYLETSIDDHGWVAEFKIPLSQLRFADKEKHIWGVQVMRMLFRDRERSYWQPIAQDSPGWVHLFGEIHGIKGIKPQKQLEVQPYLLARAERYVAEEGDPYATGVENSLDVGVDAKIGLTSDITLDLTINPDFGQVEADPSAVNLSAFQLFFREQRPFFLEGNNTLNFDMTQSNAGGFFNNDNLFYSRRIGSPPSYYPSDDDIAYVDRIDNSRILGAAKITGKNKNGFSWGILESLTNLERVEVEDTLGQNRNIAVEPMTNYVVARVQQDINQGNALIGGMFTATNRFINHSQFDGLHESAYSAGIDFTQNFDNRNYYLSLNGAFSNVNGSPTSIYSTQTNSERFFQRPDNKRARVDSTRTSLTGTGGSASFGKRNGNIIFQTGATMRSPEFELNDIGFLVQSDYVSQWSWVQFRTLKPFGVFRSFRFNLSQDLSWDFDGVNLRKSIDFNARATFNNLWSTGGGVGFYGESVSNADLRGGPAIRYPGSKEFWIYVESNFQKKFGFEINPWFEKGDEEYSEAIGVNGFFRYQPTDALRLSIGPSVRRIFNELQYVDDYSSDRYHYILGRIEQTTFAASMRINYIVTPNLSIEYWGQPFISRGEYSDFKDVNEASDESFGKRYGSFDDSQISYQSKSESYLIDDNSDGIIDFELVDPNFNFMQFRSNLVLRWEYIPGSTLFLVWTNSASAFHNSKDNRFSSLSSDLWGADASNIFLLKYTYRFIL